MKFYLSSFKLGDRGDLLQQWLRGDGAIAYVSNALDSWSEEQKKKDYIRSDMNALREAGLNLKDLDLKAYFEKPEALRNKLLELKGLWISGGNVFVLRQSMKLSGLDRILTEDLKDSDFVYGGYSAAGCVLSPRLDAYAIVDDAKDLPYPKQREQVWEGLGLIDFVFLPHFESNHPESADIEREVQYCIEHDLPFKTLRDGEVLIIE